MLHVLDTHLFDVLQYSAAISTAAEETIEPSYAIDGQQIQHTADIVLRYGMATAIHAIAEGQEEYEV